MVRRGGGGGGGDWYPGERRFVIGMGKLIGTAVYTLKF